MPHLLADVTNSGAGAPVVLLHSLALDRSIWADVVPRLGPDREVVAVDLPGHGRAPGAPVASIESVADGIAEFLRGRDGLPVTLIGMSLGGSVAQAVTIRHPELVSGLGLIDTTAWYGPDAAESWAARATQAAERGLDSLAGFQLERWFTDAFRAAAPEVGERLLAIFRANPLENYVATCEAFGRMDLRAGLSGVRVPTAVVVGESDGATPLPHAQDLLARIPGATLTVLERCKHLSAIERPDDVLAALAPVLNLGRVTR